MILHVRCVDIQISKHLFLLHILSCDATISCVQIMLGIPAQQTGEAGPHKGVRWRTERRYSVYSQKLDIQYLAQSPGRVFPSYLPRILINKTSTCSYCVYCVHPASTHTQSVIKIEICQNPHTFTFMDGYKPRKMFSRRQFTSKSHE